MPPTKQIHNNWNIFGLKINFSCSDRKKKRFNKHINFVAILINFSGHVPCVHGNCYIKINFISSIACASAISERHMQFNEKSSISCMWIYVGFWRLWFTFHFNWHFLFVFVTFCMNFAIPFDFFPMTFLFEYWLQCVRPLFVNFILSRSHRISVKRKRALTSSWIFIFVKNYSVDLARGVFVWHVQWNCVQLRIKWVCCSVSIYFLPKK